ncbi:fibronectin type III domain-containing protein [Flavobacterium sp. N1736]|uniref:fibronectin type III domain-containing protein n=1 Tax=Flavobacterium sp. N1736 TaxID=2986823 RepID=UPI0022240B63|nr:fibronectin type III domain-containing protein [Flavobacterium sp. N1736]
MKSLFKRALFFLLLVIWSFDGNAQLFPVQLTPVFNSPYSLKLADYALSMDTKMQLMINPTDVMISQRQVRLKLYIQGNGLNIQSSDYMAGQRPIFINGGELQTLTNTDIAALFRLENLQGITASQYANGLPEGMYSFCFEMFDFITNQKISQKSCAGLYLILNDPPLLNTPQKNEQIAASEFPNIMFTWTPRQMNATNISYKFELKQLMDSSVDPQFAFQMSPILYEEILFGTALLYNLSMPILTPGMRYAWRVRAISTTGLSENAVFKNNGYSEIYSFKYTQKCDSPTFALSEIVSSTSVKINWQGLPDHTKYQVQYRKKAIVETNKRGKEKEKTFEWFSTFSKNNQVLLTNLEPETTYEFRVGSTCSLESDGIQSFNYSNTNTFTIPKREKTIASYNCGIKPTLNIGNKTPITNLIESETFTAGDFPVTILELQGKGSYSGKGYIIVPYLADTKIAVEFNNIIINTDYQLISGVVETSYNADWKNVTDLEDFTGEGQGGQIEEKVLFDIKDIVINANDDIVVNGKNGEQVTIQGGKNTVIIDSSGKVYTVDSKGNGSNEGTAPAPGGKPTPENTDGVDKSGQATAFTAKGATIVFSVNRNKYAFDVMPNNASATIQKAYKKVGDTALSYKAVLNGDTDTVEATVTITDTIIKPEKIVFKTQNGANVPSTRNDKTFVLTVKGNQTYAEEQILAVIQQGDKWKVIGAFMLVHISEKEVNLVLVPLNKENQIPPNAENDISAIYKKAGIKLNITRSEKINYADADGMIEVGDTDFFETYTNEEQTINNLIKNSSNYKTDSYYLIYSDLPASKPAIEGSMALKGQFGYVFSSKNKVVSHELGHGIFGLEHPFKNKSEEDKTDFLMDYGNGLNLWHNDWKQINDPKFRLYLFQGDSEGDFNSLLYEISHYEKINYEYEDLTPDSYFNLGKVDIAGGGDRIVIKDKTGRVTDLFTSPNYTAEMWKKIKQRFWVYSQSKTTESYKWTSGYEKYSLGQGGKSNYFYGNTGTLTMINTGKYLSLDFDNFKLNMMGSIYIGPFNPIANSGFEHMGEDPVDDYSREPQDLADAAAMAHDHGYDEVEAAGAHGAFIATVTIEADIQLVRGARKIEDMYLKKVIDPYTKNPISNETYIRAKKINTLFTLIVRSKVLEINKKITPEKQKQLDKLENFSNLTINDIINPVNGRGIKYIWTN